MAVRVGGDIVGRIEVEEVKLETAQEEFSFRISYNAINDLRYISVFFNLSYYGALLAFGDDKTEELKKYFKELINDLNGLLEQAEKFTKTLRSAAISALELADETIDGDTIEDAIKKGASSLIEKMEPVLSKIKKILKVLENLCQQPEEKVKDVMHEIEKKPIHTSDDYRKYYFSFAKKLEEIKKVRIQVTTIAAFKYFNLCMNKVSEQVKSLEKFKGDSCNFSFINFKGLTWTVLINVNIMAIEALCSSLCNIQIIRENKGFECKLYCLMDRFLDYQECQNKQTIETQSSAVQDLGQSTTDTGKYDPSFDSGFPECGENSKEEID